MAWIRKIRDPKTKRVIAQYVYERLNGPKNAPICRTAGPDPETAKQIKRDLENLKAQGHNAMVSHNGTIWEYCDKYIGQPKPRQPNTKRIIQNAIDKIKGYFPEKMKIAELTESRVLDFSKHLLQKFHHTTTHMHLRSFKAIIGVAVREGIVRMNPVSETLKMLGEPRGREVYLTDKQKYLLYTGAMKVRLQYAKKERIVPLNFELVNIIKVLLNTGVRISELVNMHKEHMISDHEILIPNNRNVGYENLRPTKSKKPYIVPLNTEIMPIFQSIKAGPIFKGWNKDILEDRFRRAADLVGLTELSPHGLRHTFASDFLKKGRGNLKELKELLNHESLKMVDKYAHIERSTLKERVDAMVEPKLSIAQ